MEKSQTKSEPKDVFLHLLSIIALYVSAGSFIALVFAYINVWIPDLLEDDYVWRSYLNSIRWNISSLVVVFPVYVWSVWFLNKMFKKEPARKYVWVRRWLVYFTLFAAAVIIIGDIVALIYNFLGGDLTARFSLKVLAVLLTAGAVFVYYFWDLKQGLKIGNWKLEIDGLNYFARAVIAVVGIAVLAGFFMAGSPQEERLRRFDEQRINHLQTLQWQIVNYWQNKEKLPTDLVALRDDISGFVPPKDPETGADYTYRVKDGQKITFELCAEFNRPSFYAGDITPRPLYQEPYPVGGKLPVSETWEHKEGHACFERAIDPEIYRPLDKR